MTIRSGFIIFGCAALILSTQPSTQADDLPHPTGVESAPLDVSQMAHLPSIDEFARPDAGESTCSEQSVVAGSSTGPDLVIGHVFSCAALGHVGPIGTGTTGMSCWTTACTKGDQGTNWWGLPLVDHPMISVNLFRFWRRDGSDRLEQVGRGWIKHGFGTENRDDCGFGCTPGHFNLNGPGCSDTYAASQFVACDLGPRSMIHPYTGIMPFGNNMGPSGGCQANYPSSDHRDHVHNEVSHRVQVADTDLATANQGARFISEGQYVVPHEWVDGNGTQNNNVSHRMLQVNGPDPCGNVEFIDLGATYSESPAIDAWVGASQSMIEPAPLADGRGFLVHKVTPLGGVWRYEYALYNMNMDRSFGSLSIPLPAGAVVSNVGSHFPLNHDPEPFTENYSNTPWTVTTTGGSVTWSTTPFATDPFANAVRWGSMYNFYFDANTPPTSASATVGLFKTGTTALSAAQGPSAGPVDCDNNSIEDRCDVSCALPGCSVPGCGTKPDCDANFVPDSCEPDCNGNSIADRCDISSSFSADCEANAVPDECEPFIDCNGNLVRDACETYADISNDVNGDGIPDDCVPPASHIWFVDDNGPADPAPGFTGLSDPLENGSQAHPYDAMQEAINVSEPGDIIVVRDGVYGGVGNTILNFLGKPVLLRSEHGPEFTTVDLEFFAAFIDLSRGGGPQALRIEGFHVINLDVGQNPLPAIIGGAGASPTFRDCVFTVIGANNGTIAFRLFQNSRALISHCRFENVRTAVESFNGLPTIENSVIHGAATGIVVNAGDGSVGCVSSSSIRIVNTTISGSTTGLSVPGGNFAFVENSILWGNTTQIGASSPAAVTVSYSNIQGGWAGTGNIDADPLFVIPAIGDYRLSNGSPCIDAGNSGIADLAATDLEGGMRTFDDPSTADTGVGPPPIVDIGADEWTDCNANGIDDSIDIDNAFSADCNRNRIPDSCETFSDCNTNLAQDSCDVLNGNSQDCNVNAVPDECDTDLAGGSDDCNTNAVPDECEVDCQHNGVPDQCDITLGTSLDCSGNGVPNECEPDCQPNGIADDCDIVSSASADCNLNGRPDECDIAACAPNDPACQDCNDNGSLDSCDIIGGSPDTNGNQVPDECDAQTPTALGQNMTRGVALSVPPAQTAGPGIQTALRIRMVDLQTPIPPNAPCCPPQNFSAYEAPTCSAAGESNLCVRWAGKPVTIYESQDNHALGSYRAARLQCTPLYHDWSSEGAIQIGGPELMPSSTFQIENVSSLCMGNESACTAVSAPLFVTTARGGDVATPFNPPSSSVQPDSADVVAVLNKFRNQTGAPSKAIAQIQPNTLELNVDVGALDIVACIDAFRGLAYPYSGPCPCPSTVTCNAIPCSTPSPCSGGMCVKTCVGGTDDGAPCINDAHCPSGACGAGFCRDRCGRCSP